MFMLDHNRNFISYSSEKFKKELEKMRSHPGYDTSHVSSSLFLIKRVRRHLEKYVFLGPDCIAIVRLLYNPKTKVSWIIAINDPYDTGTKTISEFLHEFNDKNDFSPFIWIPDDLNGGTCVVNNLTSLKTPMYNCTRQLHIGVIDEAWEHVRINMLQDSKKMHKLLRRYLARDTKQRILALLRQGIFNLELLTINNNFGFRLELEGRLNRSVMPPDIKDSILGDLRYACSYDGVVEDRIDPYSEDGRNPFSAAKKMRRNLPYTLSTRAGSRQNEKYIFDSQALFPLLYCASVPNAVIMENKQCKRYDIITCKQLRSILQDLRYAEIDLDLEDDIVEEDSFDVHLEELDLWP